MACGFALPVSAVLLGLALLSAGPTARLPIVQTDPAYKWNGEGLAAADRGAYKEAEALYLKAMDRWHALGPGYDVHFAITEMNLAQAQYGQGLRTQCLKSLDDSLAILRRTLGVRAERTLENFNMLAGVVLLLGDVDHAEKLFNEALPIERELYPHSLNLARTLDGLATVRTQQWKLDEALHFAEEALSLALEIDGDHSVDAALAYSAVAEIHRAAGRLDRALPLYRKSQDIYEKLLGPEHPRVGALLSQEGLVRIGTRQYAMAEKALLRAQQILDKNCSARGYEQSLTLHNLGLLRLRQQRFKEADRLLTKALAIQEQYMQRPGPMMADTLEALAEVLRHERRFEEAQSLKSRADIILSHR